MSTLPTQNATEGTDEKHMARWFVMRDLKRANAKTPAYIELTEMGVEAFTPTHTIISVKGGRRVKEVKPVISDLLFVHDSQERLDPIVARIQTLQYRFVKGKPHCEPMTVRNEDMDRFIAVARSAEQPIYYNIDELTPDMIGKEIRIVGGPLDGHHGNLLALKGSRKKQIIVSIPDIIAASVEVSPEFIEYIG